MGCRRLARWMSRGMRTSAGSMLATFGELLDELHLGQRPGIPDVERLTLRPRFRHGANESLHQVVDIDELHEAITVAGDDDGPAGAHAVPKELFAVERIARPVNERRTECHQRQAGLPAHTEQQALGVGLVANVGGGMRVGRQRVALLVVQAVAVRGHAGHKDVAA